MADNVRFKFVMVWTRIPELIAFVETESRAAVMKNADKVVKRAKELAPVQTGYLQSSISSKSVEAGKSAEITAEAPYALYVEYGTYKMSARPFLGPAISQYADEFFDEVGKGLFAKF